MSEFEPQWGERGEPTGKPISQAAHDATEQTMALVAELKNRHPTAMVINRIYLNEAQKEILEFSVQYPTPKPVGQVTKQARRAAITFNTATLPDDLEASVLAYFEANL